MNRNFVLMRAVQFGLVISLLNVTAIAQEGGLPKFVAIYAASYYEYTKDGSATLGFITLPIADGKVQFTMCDGNKTQVSFKDLRVSKGKCNRKRKDQGPLQITTNQLAPIYKVSGDQTNTKVLFQGKILDLKTFENWQKLDITLPEVQANEPVGFVFKNSEGTKAMAILQNDSPEYRK